MPPNCAATMRILRLCGAFTGLALAPALGFAQQASPYVPIDHWAMPFIEHLISAGIIADPTPNTRPIRQSQLLHALETADTTHATPAVRAMIRRLVAEWVPASSAPHYRAEPILGAQASTFSFRDPLELDRGACTTNQCDLQLPGHRLSDRTFANIGLD